MPASVLDIPRLHLKDIEFSAPKHQTIVPSFACIPGPSRNFKIEAPLPIEIEHFFPIWLQKKNSKRQLSLL